MSSLRREIGLPGAVLLGLGSMVGTGVFVSLGIAIGVAEWGVLAAIAFAALLALANALSSAQLAAAHPVSGGTYEYGRRYLTPSLGFAAGWTFLCAKCASAATAALGCSLFLKAIIRMLRRSSEMTGVDGTGRNAGAIATSWPDEAWVVPAVSIVIVLLLTALVAGGIRRSNRTNAVIVSVTLASLVAFVVVMAATIGDAPASVDENSPAPATAVGAALAPAAAPEAWSRPSGSVLGASSAPALLQAIALLFVAFTGYGRLATLGEEVRDPRTVIPRAIVITMVVVTLLYLAVAWVSLHATAAGNSRIPGLSGSEPTLDELARARGVEWLAWIVSIGGVTAMLGVLLNLLLGLSRVVLAMARQGDAPAALSRIDERHASPVRAVLACGAAIAVMAAIGSVRFSWSLSAFTVLLYYAITNAAALRLPAPDRRFPRWVAAAGLIACLALAFWVEWRAWLTGVILLAIGFAIRGAFRGIRAAPRA